MHHNACSSREHQIVDALFGDLDTDSLQALQDHMATCDGCAHAFAQMEQTLAITAEVKEPALSESYWENYYEQLEERIAEANRPVFNWKRLGLVDRLRGFMIPRPVMQWSAALALVLFGVLIGRQWASGPASVSNPGEITTQIDPALTPVQLTEKTEQYLDRSKVLLLGLVNFDVNEDDPAYLNLSRQQEIAGELVLEAAYLKEELAGSREQQLAVLVEELERILLQIANLELQEDVPSIELIQRGVDQGALLMKINLEKMKRSEERMEEQTPAQSSELIQQL